MFNTDCIFIEPRPKLIFRLVIAKISALGFSREAAPDLFGPCSQTICNVRRFFLT